MKIGFGGVVKLVIFTLSLPLVMLYLHVGNPSQAYTSTHSTSGSLISSLSLKLNLTLIITLTLTLLTY